MPHQTYTYDNAERISTIFEAYGSVKVRYTYDDAGNVIEENYGTSSNLIYNAHKTYTYSPAGQVTKEEYKAPYYSSVSWSEDYTYRLDGNMMQKTSSGGGNSYKTAYSYDIFGRPYDEAYYKNNLYVYQNIYEYDDYNNISSVDQYSSVAPKTTFYNETTCTDNYSVGTYSSQSTAPYHYQMSYTYDKAGQLQTQLTTDAKNGNATVNDFSFTYDDAGNLLSKLDDDITKQTYTYDALNRTASFTDNAVGETTNYIYNYADRRIGKTGATTLTSIWSGGMITLDITNISQPSTNRLYINGGVNYGMVVNYSYMPRTANAQGDTAFNTTPGNDIVNFDQYGNQNNGQALTDESNPYGYRGYYGDVESGNYYLSARYYDPEIQRFTQPDTYRGNNPYAYSNGDPVKQF
ncbi:MAG: hypothetical protein PHR14_09945 [Oscillospiraceae bacterium]|nr:hypothetical protein [Oscillospiraceae bacterium]